MVLVVAPVLTFTAFTPVLVASMMYSSLSDVGSENRQLPNTALTIVSSSCGAPTTAVPVAVPEMPAIVMLTEVLFTTVMI